jgi:hypothetical protein
MSKNSTKPFDTTDESKGEGSMNQSTQMSQLNNNFHENNAADGRKMRRVIAEDLEWNLMTIPSLSDLCTKSIIKNFATHPRHDELPKKFQKKILQQIQVESIPLKLGSYLISDNHYWERCCKSKWRVNDVSKYGNSWKRMYFERELKSLIENFIPNKTEQTRLDEILKLGFPYIIKLDIMQLLPPVELEKKEFNLDAEEEEEEKEEIKEKFDCDHFDFSLVIPFLSNLEELHISYSVKDCGMNFEWQLFDFTKRDCQVLSKCISQCTKLKSLHINRSKIDDDKIRLFVTQILDHPSLKELNLSHNLISDRGCRAIGKFINGHSQIENLILSNNQIKAQGAQALAHALVKNSIIKNLDLRLNRLGDEGGQAIGNFRNIFIFYGTRLHACTFVPETRSVHNVDTQRCVVGGAFLAGDTRWGTCVFTLAIRIDRRATFFIQK